jgi:hypothetical protein
MLNGVIVFLAVVWGIVLLVAYHKLFDVVYLNLFNGIFRELIGAFIGASILTYATLHFWYVVVIVVIIAGIVISKKLLSKAPIVLSVIVAIIFAVAGISFGSTLDENGNVKDDGNSTTTTSQSAELY